MKKLKKISPLIILTILIASLFSNSQQATAITQSDSSETKLQMFSSQEVLKQVRNNTYYITDDYPLKGKDNLPQIPSEKEKKEKINEEKLSIASSEVIRAPRIVRNGDKFVTDVVLKTEEDIEIVNNDTLYYNTMYKLYYTWEIDDTKELDGEKNIYFSIPREMIIDSPFSFPVKNNTGQIVGNSVVEGNNDNGYYIKMVLTTYGESLGRLDGTFELITHVNETYVNEGDTTIDFPNNPLDVEFPSQGGSGGGDGTGSGNKNNLKKNGRVEYSDGGGRHIKWVVTLGYNSLMGTPINGKPENGFEPRFNSWDEIESITLHDTPEDQKIISMQEAYDWDSGYAYNKLFWPNYPWDYGEINENEITFVDSGGEHIGLNTDLKPYIDRLIGNQEGPFNDYAFEYVTKPLDPTSDQKLTNEATVTIKGTDSSEVHYVLTSSVKWSAGGGTANGTTGKVKLIKFDSEDPKIKLEDAEFDLYREENGEWVEENINVVTNDKGEIIIGNLKVGSYKFVETDAPPGYMLPEEPDNEFYFEITKDDVKDETFVIVDAPNDPMPDRELIFTKLDDKGKPILQSNSGKQAQFHLQVKKGSKWERANNKVYQVDSNGQFIIEEDEFKSLEPGNDYRFIEVKAPYGYVLEDNYYSEEFRLERFTVTPEEIEMENIKLNHQLKVKKTVEFNTGISTPTSPAGIEFVIQGRNTGDWERYSNETFVTNSNGEIIIDNTTNPEFIQGMVDSNYQQFRLRESKVPPGRGLRDPQYPTNGKEADGPPGNDFAITIPIKELRDKTNAGKNYVVDNLTLENKLIRYTASLRKVDSINGNQLKGAEFTVYEKNKPDDKRVIQEKNGIYEIENLIINREYVVVESKAPEGYGAVADEYYIKLDLTNQMHVSKKGETTTVDLKDGTDYRWNGKELLFEMDIKNPALPKMPMTGGIGVTLYTLSSLLFVLIGSLLFMTIKKGEKRHGKRK